ncbi:MAG: hypothetical protein U0840_24750 [Gemmataceae bacterium]
MARCEQGYLCAVCGQEVEEIGDSDLYLAYVLGEVGPDELLRRRERHIVCNRERAQYIVDERFPAVRCEGFFDKAQLDQDHVRAEEARITRGWRRLQEVVAFGLPIDEYPLGAEEA